MRRWTFRRFPRSGIGPIEEDSPDFQKGRMRLEGQDRAGWGQDRAGWGKEAAGGEGGAEAGGGEKF